MGGGSSRDAHVPAPLMATGRRVMYSPPVPAVCVRCPLCSRVLRPPTGHAVFRCPCGSVLSNGAAAPPRSSPAASPAEQLILRSIQGLPPSHPQRLFLLHLLAALPRNEAGAVDERASSSVLARLAQQLEPQGASQSLLDLLPTRTYHASECAAATPDRSDEAKQCMVCLCEYEEGEELRTLPCMHFFHKGCVDTWLTGKKQCPLCKTPVDIGLPR